MFLLFFIVLPILAISSVNEGVKIDFVHQRYTTVTDNHRTFTESQSIILSEMNYCLPINIQYIINNLTSLYNPFDNKCVTKGLFFTKFSKDVQNYKPFCEAINDATDVYIRRMSYLINMKYYKPHISKEIKERAYYYNTYRRCLDESVDIQNKQVLFKCLKDTERRALFNALRQ